MSYFKKRIPLIIELGFNQEQIDKLEAYIDLLWKANEELNLISRKMTFEELIDNHLIDCLLPLKIMPEKLNSIADFGSGGGLPGVVYAIQFPNIQFHLFEKSPSKQKFLTQCKEFAPNITVHGEIPKVLKGIDLIIARAFKPIDVILELSRTNYKNNGKYFLLKARREKIDEELNDARKKFKDLKVKIIPLKSPVLDVERHLVLIG